MDVNQELDGLYPSSIFTTELLESMSAHKWWALMSTRTADTEFKEFCQIIAKLHACPASSAGIERIFSTFGHVWSKFRNKLGIEKVFKLVTIYKYLTNGL